MHIWCWKRLGPSQLSTRSGTEAKCMMMSSSHSPRGLRPRYGISLWRCAALSDPSCNLDLADLAHTAGARRGHHDYRLALVASSRDEVVEALDAYRRGEPHLSSLTGRRLSGRRPRAVFVFSGHGGLWQGAGRALFDLEPSFRDAIERCDSILRGQLGWSPAAELRASRSLFSDRRPRCGSSGSVCPSGRPGSTMGIVGNRPGAVGWRRHW